MDQVEVMRKAPQLVKKAGVNDDQDYRRHILPEKEEFRRGFQRATERAYLNSIHPEGDNGMDSVHNTPTQPEVGSERP